MKKLGGNEVGKIEVIGLGAGNIEQLPFGLYQTLKNAPTTIYARTLDHPVITYLQEEGVHFQSFDMIYEKHHQFDAVYEEIVDILVRQAETEDILYAVPGHPMLAERTVQLLLAHPTADIHLLGGQSYLDDLFTALKIDPIDGFQFVDGTSFDRTSLQYKQHIIFCQVYDAFIASDVKLALLEDLPAHYEVTIVEAAGTVNEKLLTVPLEELDRVMEMSNLTSVYVPPIKEALPHHFQTLRETIQILRGPNGCPWDRKQTHASLRKYLQEEAYELIDAIQREDDEGIIEELGDVLLQVMLHSQIGEDDGYFTVDDVIRSITEKMIHRHPHVFGDGENNKTWDELKREEKSELKHSMLDDIITFAPALQVADEVQRKAAKVGFDWDEVTDVWLKWEEELQEFKEAAEANDEKEMEKEFGDMLFVLANIARFYDIYPEHALQQTNEKFIRRFKYVEQCVKESNKEFHDFTLAQLDHFWNEAKKKE